MKYLGLTKERYNQMMEFYNNDEEEVKYVVDEWGIENCNKGYAIFDYDGTGMLNVEKIDDVGAFESDIEAKEQAIKDGIKIIPVDELSNKFDEDYEKQLGWIDTKENRKAIEDYFNR